MFGLKNYSGVNNLGRKTVLKGSRVKKRYRLIDFYRIYNDVPAIVIRLDYDPNRSANIALICYKNGFLSYILATEGLKKGMVLNSINKNFVGSSLQIRDIEFGTFVCCLEMVLRRGGKVARSAGTFCVLVAKINQNECLVRFPSGIEKLVSQNLRATLGVISNKSHHLFIKGKAGCSSRLGYKSHVRGVAKNCVDHPNGGGRGKTSP